MPLITYPNHILIFVMLVPCLNVIKLIFLMLSGAPWSFLCVNPIRAPYLMIGSLYDTINWDTGLLHNVAIWKKQTLRENIVSYEQGFRFSHQLYSRRAPQSAPFLGPHVRKLSPAASNSWEPYMHMLRFLTHLSNKTRTAWWKECSKSTLDLLGSSISDSQFKIFWI